MDDMADIEFDDNGRTRLRALQDGQQIGKIDYFVLDQPPTARVGVHTEVDPDHQGEGIAGKLAAEFYRRAAEAGQGVVPLCPYLKRWSLAHPEQAPAPDDELTARAMVKLREDPATW
ncbi:MULTISPECIES: GNAT family N-acetyltransferase [Streptacidiphilus]|uniref:GNAT family N-acetyltransferase n=2 Tax=Streptacidiphilus TaxID=228398 RepID=A0ABV6UQW0_9ACTN